MQQQQKQNIRNWSELNPELLLEISNRLGTKPDLYNFRQVCKNWRLSLSKTLPFLSPLFPHRFFSLHNSDFFSSFSRGTLHHVIADAILLIKPNNNLLEPSKPWIVTVEEFYSGKLSVKLPLSRIRAKGVNLNLNLNLNLNDFDVNLIAKGFSWRIPEYDKTLCVNGGLGFKNKLVLFGNSGLFKPEKIDDYTGLVWFRNGSVAWFRFSRSLDWGYLVCEGMSKFDDIVNFKGKVYGVDRRGRVYVVNYELKEAKGRDFRQSLRVERVVNDSISSGCDSDRRKRLVVDCYGVLYLVERGVYCGDKVNFRVYKVDDEKDALEEVVGIGERILFVGLDWCFFGSKFDFPGCRGNCVIFSKDSFPMYKERVSPSVLIAESFLRGTKKELEFGVFHFEDGDAGPISAFPGYSEFLWPPPSWFCPTSSSSS